MLSKKNSFMTGVGRVYLGIWQALKKISSFCRCVLCRIPHVSWNCWSFWLSFPDSTGLPEPVHSANECCLCRDYPSGMDIWRRSVPPDSTVSSGNGKCLHICACAYPSYFNTSLECSSHLICLVTALSMLVVKSGRLPVLSLLLWGLSVAWHTVDVI